MFSCNKDYSNKYDEELKNHSRAHLNFLITISINLFFVRKGVYAYKYMDEWEKFNNTSLPEKEEF